MTNFKTDAKLLLLLNGEKIFTGNIDPENILSNAKLLKLNINVHSALWSALYAFNTGEQLILGGKFQQCFVPIIDKMIVPQTNKEKTDIKINPSKTLLQGLGQLDELPVHLRRNLSAPAKTDATNTHITMEEYLDKVNDALLWGIELFQKKEPLKDFSKYSISFERNKDGEITKAVYRLTDYLDEGQIILQTDATVYGLGGKNVTLKKNLGMKHTAEINCTAMIKDREIPSLKTAFDLYEAIPIIYQDERKKRIEPLK